jgi:hypothetical protein
MGKGMRDRLNKLNWLFFMNLIMFYIF